MTSALPEGGPRLRRPRSQGHDRLRSKPVTSFRLRADPRTVAGGANTIAGSADTAAGNANTGAGDADTGAGDVDTARLPVIRHRRPQDRRCSSRVAESAVAIRRSMERSACPRAHERRRSRGAARDAAATARDAPASCARRVHDGTRRVHDVRATGPRWHVTRPRRRAARPRLRATVPPYPCPLPRSLATPSPGPRRSVLVRHACRTVWSAVSSVGSSRRQTCFLSTLVCVTITSRSSRRDAPTARRLSADARSL